MKIDVWVNGRKLHEARSRNAAMAMAGYLEAHGWSYRFMPEIGTLALFSPTQKKEKINRLTTVRENETIGANAYTESMAKSLVGRIVNAVRLFFFRRKRLEKYHGQDQTEASVQSLRKSDT